MIEERVERYKKWFRSRRECVGVELVVGDWNGEWES